jgi:hypothetical protein
VIAAGRAITTQIVVMEILIGARTEEQYRDLQEDFSALRLVPINAATWQQATRLGFDLCRGGLSIPTTDLLIATAALAYDAAVLHADRHFDLIATRTLLRVESLLALLPGS